MVMKMVMKNEVLNKINEMLKKIKDNLKELEFDVDQIQEYIIITISYKGVLYECNYTLELELNEVKEDTYKILTSEIKEFYDKARKADNILMSIRDEILKLLNKFIDHIPENVSLPEIILDTTDDMEVYEAYIEFKDIGITITLQYFYYKNKLKLHSINISANNAEGVKEAHELLEHIIHYFLVKKQLKNIT